MMKKANILLAAALVMLSACQEIEVPVPEVAPDEIHASIEGMAPSKTMLNDNNSICWTEGDQIVIFLKNSVGLKYQLDPQSAGKTNATFTKVQEQNRSRTQELTRRSQSMPIT